MLRFQATNGTFAGATDPRLLVSSAEGHHERLADGLEVGLVPHGSVERQDRGDVETRGVLKRGEAGDRFGQPAGPGVGEILRGPQPVGGSSPAVSPLIAGA